MAAADIRVALGLLQDDFENESAFEALFDAVTDPQPGEDLRALLEAARRGHESRREWEAVVRVLELELALVAGTPVEFAVQFELARILEEELLDGERAPGAWRRLHDLRPDEPTAAEALARSQAEREREGELVSAALDRAGTEDSAARRAAALAEAAEITLRHHGADDAARAQAASWLQSSLAQAPATTRAGWILERLQRSAGDWEASARTLEAIAEHAADPAERAGALVRLARVARRKLGDEDRAARAYQALLAVAPADAEALGFLAEHWSRAERWDELVALYEAQLRGGAVRAGEETALLLQIAMVHWRMRDQPQAAEPWFERLRRSEPAHPGMLGFFREHLGATGDRARLMTVLGDAQRALRDGPEKVALAAEIAKLAEAGSNAQKAIEQYKTLLRGDPANEEARAALERLYAQSESWSALVDLLRSKLDRLPADDRAGRLAVLREIARIQHEKIGSETALVTVLGQIVQLDPEDVGALRELVRVYESLGRFRDLLQQQTRLADLLPPSAEKSTLLRSVARRWLEQFTNVQNATEAYEALLVVEPDDEEAIGKLRELYLKRRAWGPLRDLLAKLAERAAGPARTELLGEVARIAAERLDRGDEAIAIWERLLDEDPERSELLDLADKQAERDKDFAAVARLLERRLAREGSDSAKLALLQKLGGVYEQRLSDPAAAARTWRQVLAIQPGHPKALRVLREAYLASGDLDALEELYGSSGDWDALAEVLSSAADRADATAAKVDLSWRAARVLEERVGSPDRAARQYERILATQPGDARAARALLAICERAESWARVPALLEALLAAAEDDDARLALTARLVEVTGERLGDRASALRWAVEAARLAPGEATLDALEAASRAAGSWDAYIESVEARLRKKKGVGAADKRALRVRLARLYGEIGRIDEAVTLGRKLVADDGDEELLAWLDGLLRAHDRRDDLRWLLDSRAQRLEGAVRAAALVEWAELEENAFGEPARAAALHRLALEADPDQETAGRALPRLLLSIGDAAGAAEALAARRERAQGDERAARELDLAEVLLGPAERPEDALASVLAALDLAPADARAIALLERLVAIESTRAGAALALEQAYAATGDVQRQADAIALRLPATRDAGERLALHLRLAELRADGLGDASLALDGVLAALAEAPASAELWDRAAELATASLRPADLAAAYERVLAADPPLDEELEIEVCTRAAHLLDEKLGEPDAAVPYLERILSRRPDEEGAFARLKQLLTARERWQELEKLYQRAIDATVDVSRKVDLLHELALVAEEITGETARAIDSYERILALEPGHDGAAHALEQLYAREGRWESLAELLGARLAAAAPDEATSLSLRLARIELERLDRPESALRHVEEVLVGDANEAEARQLAERILAIPALEARAAELLESVHEARDDAADLARVLEVRLRTIDDPDQRRERLAKVATLRETRLGDEAGTLDALARLVPLDPADADARERLLDVARRLGEHARAADVLDEAAKHAEPQVRVEVLLEVGRICDAFLAAPARAERAWKEALDAAGDDADLALPAARALETLYATAERHTELAAILERQVALQSDGVARAELLSRLGELYETAEGDAARAIDAWRRRLEEDAADEGALGALSRLYARTGAWSELVGTLEARRDLASDPDERRGLGVEAARVLDEKLDDVDRAIASFAAVVDDFGPEAPALEALERLYERAARWDDLADALDVHLSLVDDATARAGLLARLGEVRRLRQGEPARALDALREALALDPAHAAARAELWKLLDAPEARRDAAEALRPLCEADGENEALLRVLDAAIDTADGPGEQLDALDAAARTAEGPLADPARAFAYAARAVRAAAAEPDAGRWVERATQLAEKTGRWTELFELLRDVAPDLIDGDVQLAVARTLAELARDRLGDGAAAVRWLERALELRSDDTEALVALEKLHEAAGDASALLDVLRRHVDAATDDEERRELLLRQGALLAGSLSDPAGAASAYEAALDVRLDADAAAALEAVYRAAERWEDLVALCERRLGEGVSATADLHAKIAEVARVRLGDLPRAFDEIDAALREDATHAPALAELEALLAAAEAPEDRARAAAALEPSLLARDDWRGLLATLEVRLAASQDPDERRALLRRIATLEEERADDAAAALETGARLLHEDVGDAATWTELERLAERAGAKERLAAIYAAELDAIDTDEPATADLAFRAGAVFASLGQADRALALHRRALAFEPESRERFDAVDRLLVAEGRAEERVDLWRAALEHRYDPADRTAALHAIARLEQEALGDLERAAATWREALDADEGDEVAQSALASLYRAAERWDDLVELLDRRADAVADAERAADLRLERARVLAGPLGRTEDALDVYERIVDELPEHRATVDEIEKLAAGGAHRARAIAILEPLYRRRGEWQSVVRVEEERLAVVEEPSEKVAILREIANLWEDRGDDRGAALGALARAFALDPDDGDTRAELERVAESISAWDDLAAAYEHGVATAEPLVRRGLLHALAQLHDERRDDPRGALDAWARLSDLDATEPEPVEAMDRLATLLGDWPRLARAVERAIEQTLDDERKASLLRRLGELRFEMLDDAAGAIEAWNDALELEPESTRTLDALLGALHPDGDPARRAELYARRFELAAGDDELRHLLARDAARLAETALRDRAEAIRWLGEALASKPGDRETMRDLGRLLAAEGRWEDLLEQLRLEASAADDAGERVDVRKRIAALWDGELANPSEALDAWRQVIDEAPADEDALAAVRAIGERHEELRAAAADVLEPVLRAAGRADDLLAVLAMRLAAQSDPADRARTLRAVAALHERDRGAPGLALDALLAALAEAPDDAELHADAMRLSAAEGGFARYADALEERAQASLDSTVARDLFTRVGAIAEEKLGDEARAVRAWRRVLEVAGDDGEALAALDRLVAKSGDAAALAEILERRAAFEADPRGQADLLCRLARLQLDAGDGAKALGTLRQALDKDLDHAPAREALEALTGDRELFDEAADALQAIYRAHGDHDRLATLSEKRIAFADGARERIRLRLDLARMLEERALDGRRAQRAVEAALGDDPLDADVLDELERLAAQNDDVATAASRLAEALDAASDLPADAARDGWTKVATWRQDRADDAAGAEQAWLRAAQHDPESVEILRRIEALQQGEGRERDRVATLRKLARLEGDPATRREILRDAAVLAAQGAGDPALAEEILRELLASDETNVWALEYLERLREHAGAWNDVVDLALRRAEATDDGAEAVQLRRRAAEIARERLGDDARAIELWRTVLEAEPDDAETVAHLRAAYERTARHADLAELLRRRIDASADADERAALRLDVARLESEAFGDAQAAIDTLRALLDELPAHGAAFDRLVSLYEAADRSAELAELLAARLDHVRGEEAELTLALRLGALRDERLRDAEGAIEAFETALARDPANRVALVALARLLDARGDHARVAGVLERLLATAEGPEASALSLRLADAYAATGDDDGARRTLEAALERDADHAESRARLAGLYERTSAWGPLAELLVAEAEATAEPAARARKHREAARLHLDKREAPEPAAALLERAVEATPDDRELLVALCDAYQAAGRSADAAAVLEKLVASFGGKRSKELAPIHQKLSRAYLAAGDRARALGELDAAFKVDPGSISILRDLGTLALEADDLDKAQRTFRALLLQKLDATAPIGKGEVFYYLGEISRRQGDKTKAIQMLERALENDAKLAKARELLAELKG